MMEDQSNVRRSPRIRESSLKRSSSPVNIAQPKISKSKLQKSRDKLTDNSSNSQNPKEAQLVIQKSSTKKQSKLDQKKKSSDHGSSMVKFTCDLLLKSKSNAN